MVATPQPVYDAWKHVTKDLPYKPVTIYMSPQGKVLTQDIAKRLAGEKHIIILCGHMKA